MDFSLFFFNFYQIHSGFALICFKSSIIKRMQIHLMKLQLRLVFIYSHLDIEAWTISQVQKLAAIFLFQFAAVFLRIYA
jgi:hypothetical protein